MRSRTPDVSSHAPGYDGAQRLEALRLSDGEVTQAAEEVVLRHGRQRAESRADRLERIAAGVECQHNPG
jgi:hypothetical protein